MQSINISCASVANCSNAITYVDHLLHAFLMLCRKPCQMAANAISGALVSSLERIRSYVGPGLCKRSLQY